MLAEWLYATAMRCGHAAQSTSIPGVAQRTGATTYYIEMFARRPRLAGARAPVFSLNPVPGAIDLLVSSEPLETVRQVGTAIASAERTRGHQLERAHADRVEKMQLGDGRATTRALLATLREYCRARRA